jgi:hypothetical protein
MSRQNTRDAVPAFLLLIVSAGTAWAGGWTDPVAVRYDLHPCISYRARLEGGFLIVQAAPEAGWHTFAMDNRKRAEEKLAGKPSLGIDSPTEIKISRGLETAGPWYQSPPKDFSKPELQWFTWGFDGPALFVTKVRRSGPGPAQVAITGQVCTDKICKQVDVAISLPLAGAQADANPPPIDFAGLVRVR